MTSYQLKVLACLFMLIDHIGAILFPNIFFLRVIGRLAFPMFAYFIVEGYRKTKDITDYLGRLFTFALISQLPFNAAFLGSFLKPERLYLNVFFTLAMGLYALYKFDKDKKMNWVLIIAIACQIVNTDYGAYGVLFIFIINKYFEEFKLMSNILLKLAGVLIALAIIVAALPLGENIKNEFSSLGVGVPISLLSLFLLKLYNGERGLRLKYIFYAFYPVHLVLLAVINNFI